MAEKKSFVLYTEYEENLQELPDEELGQLFRAIFGYVNRGVVPDLSPSCKMAFSFIRKDLDRNQAKYEETCRRRAEAGQKGGLAKASNAKQKLANGSNAKQDVANLADNENVNENENVNVNVNGNGNVNDAFRPRCAGTNPFLILMEEGT